MTKISKYPLNRKVEERIFDVFWNTIAGLSSQKRVQDFFYDLMTPTERLMFTKRFAIAILLEKQYTYKQISDILKVSETTIGTTSRWLKYEGTSFKNEINRIIRKERSEQFWEKLDEFLTFALPPRRNTNWSRVRSQQRMRIIKRRRKRTAI